jgi:galactosylceramidase
MLRLAPSLLLLQQLYNANSLEITLSGDAPFQIYDGHGGLSAGASSRLLLDYNEPQRSEVLDYLYKPNFGANLHMCKIEIGGDTQSTDGTEPSYKHYREEPPVCGVNRGYEMWLLSEANKRNPDVQSFLLSWGVPNWVGNGTFFSE